MGHYILNILLYLLYIDLVVNDIASIASNQPRLWHPERRDRAYDNICLCPRVWDWPTSLRALV